MNSLKNSNKRLIEVKHSILSVFIHTETFTNVRLKELINNNLLQSLLRSFIWSDVQTEVELKWLVLVWFANGK